MVKWLDFKDCVLLVIVFFLFCATYVAAQHMNEVAYTQEVQPSDNLRMLAEHVVRDCAERDKQCEIETLEQWINDEVKYVPDNWFDNMFWANDSPMKSFQRGYNDCDGLSILFLSMWKSLHPEDRTYLVWQPNHVCYRINEQYRYCNDDTIYKEVLV